MCALGLGLSVYLVVFALYSISISSSNFRNESSIKAAFVGPISTRPGLPKRHPSNRGLRIVHPRNLQVSRLAHIQPEWATSNILPTSFILPSIDNMVLATLGVNWSVIWATSGTSWWFGHLGMGLIWSSLCDLMVVKTFWSAWLMKQMQPCLDHRVINSV